MRRLALIMLFSTALAAAEPERGKLAENIAARSDPTQTYTLYLPASYDALKQHPLLYVFDPRGRGTLGAQIFKDAAEEYGWIIISSNQTRSDDDGAASVRAVRALMPERHRYAVHPRRVYAAGFSGTAILSWAIGITDKAFAGVIGVGGRLVDDAPPARFAFAHYGFAGDADFNNREMRVIDDMLEKEGKTHRFQEFRGDHRWLPPELAREAIGWMELLATQDASLAARLYPSDLAAANALSGVAALRRYREIVRTYQGLHVIDGAAAAVARLEADPAIRRELHDIARWDEFEVRVLTEVQKIQPRDFRVAELQRRAKRDGAEGATARRLLEAIYAQASFYVPRQLMEKREYERAAAFLEVAVRIHPGRWPAWYHLGAAYARAGHRRRAIESLEKAVAAGFEDRERLLTEEHFASLRADPRFGALLASRSQ